MALIEVTSTEQFEELLRRSEKAAVEFTAAWSGPGQLIHPVFERLSEQYHDIGFVSVDVDRVAPVAQAYGIRAMPTFIFFKHGEKSDDLMGTSKAGLEGKVKTLAS
ncbi:thioredoxin family protein [Streptomyces antibioticus]|uniref:Thioredoxin n=1 Tax=Streptomyces antibioticus TaxID=1890 RepID=A0AAE7CPJ4_STRAT|nr:thioredoxin family protein [Streptomyces antibioticus]MBO7939260.1 thioredoxin family protein [Streptomyces sp. S9]QIT48622.1 thioredoxin family protein [Streptomyces antibioticus]